MKIVATLCLSALIISSCAALPQTTLAQQSNGNGTQSSTDAGLPTLFSVKASGGWGIGRSTQLYGYSGNSPVYWSTGQGIKMNLALDIPIVPIEVVNDDPSVGPSKIPVVALELEFATGYLPSTGGTTVDALNSGGLETTDRSTGYVPITLGLNARSSFGPGLPSVYIGAGAGVFIVAEYQESVSFSNSTPGFTRLMNPPVPFGIYGDLGIEMPVMYSSEDGNSFMDLFAEMRITEMSTYVYNYQVKASDGSITTVDASSDPAQLYIHEPQRSASNLALTLGVRFNIY